MNVVGINERNLFLRNIKIYIFYDFQKRVSERDSKFSSNSQGEREAVIKRQKKHQKFIYIQEIQQHNNHSQKNKNFKYKKKHCKIKSENELLPNWNYDDVSSGRSNVLKVRELNYLSGQILLCNLNANRTI